MKRFLSALGVVGLLMSAAPLAAEAQPMEPGMHRGRMMHHERMMRHERRMMHHERMMRHERRMMMRHRMMHDRMRNGM